MAQAGHPVEGKSKRYGCDHERIYGSVDAIGPAQQPADNWIGGHLTEPYEQKTQQSPGFGRIKTWQLTHSWK